MRRMRGALLVLLTAVLVAGGATLPYIASLVQDRYLESEVDVWTFDPVGLRLGDEPAVWPALCLMAGECEWLGWNSETNLSEEEARAAAREAAALLEKSGLAEPGVAGVGLDEIWTETSLLVSGGVRGLSAVLWSCSWNVVDNLGNFLFCTLLIDDSTGKLVQAVVSGPAFEETESIYAQMENWRTFLEDYYGLEVEVLGERTFEQAVYDKGEGAGQALGQGAVPERRFILGFDLGEELGRQKVLLDLLAGMTAFNIQ
ncbi:MAG: hypothetical protein K2O93_09360 [Oscillospiraceae bacterium]|nr:hypothetical protein [Oscillospiraceae bacterium]